jgi:hypothetical protein
MPARKIHCGASFEARINNVVRGSGAMQRHCAPNKSDSTLRALAAAGKTSGDRRSDAIGIDLSSQSRR